MVSREALGKILRICAEAKSIGAVLAKTPPIERASVIRPLLLNHCRELRAIIDTGTTDACGVPVIDILQRTQRVLRDVRRLRETERRKAKLAR